MPFSNITAENYFTEKKASNHTNPPKLELASQEKLYWFGKEEICIWTFETLDTKALISMDQDYHILHGSVKYE